MRKSIPGERSRQMHFWSLYLQCAVEIISLAIFRCQMTASASRSILRSTRQSIGTVQTSFCHAVFYVPPVRVSEPYKHRSVTQYSTFHPSEYRNRTNIVLSRSILRSTRQSIGTVQTSFCHAVFYVPPVRVSEPYKHRSVTQYSTFHPSEYRNRTNIVLSRSILRSTRQSIGTVQTSFCHAVFYVPPVRVSEPYKHRSVTQYSTFHPSEYRNRTTIVLSRSILRSTRQSIGTVQTSFCHAVFYVPPVRVSEPYKHRSFTQYSTFHPSEYRNRTNIVLSRSILRSTRQSIGTVQTSFCHAVFYVPPVRVSELYKHRSVTQYSTFHPSEYRNCTNIVLSRSILRSTRQSIGTVQTSFCHAVFYVPPVRVSELYKHRSVTQYSTLNPSEYRNRTNIVLSRSILRSTRQSIGTVQTSFCHAVFYVPPVRVSEPYKHRSVTQYSTFHPSEYRNRTNIVLSRSILRSTRQSIGTVQTSFCHAVFYVPPVRVSELYKHRSVTQYSTFHPSEYRNCTNIVLSRSILRSTRQSIGTVQTSFCHAVFYVPPVRVSELYKHRSVTQSSTFHPSEYRNRTNIVLSRSILRSTRQSIGTVQTSFCHAVFYVPPVRVSEPYKHRSVTQYSTFHPSEYRNCTNIVLSRSILRSTRQSIGTVQTSFCHAVFYVPPVRVSELYKHRSVTQYSTLYRQSIGTVQTSFCHAVFYVIPSEYRNCTNIVLSRSILRSTRQSIGTVQTSFCHAVFYVPPVRVSELYKHRSVTQYSTFHPSEYRNCTNIVLSRSILRSTRQSIGTVQTSFCHAVFYVPPVRVSEPYKHRSVTQSSTFHPSEYRNCTNIVLSRSILRSTRQSIGTVQTSFCHAVFYVPPVRVSELYKHRSVTQYSTFHPSEYRNCTNIVLSRSILRSTRQSIGTVQTSFCHAVFYVPPVRVSEPYKHRSVTQYSTFHPSEYRNRTNIVLSRSILRSTRQSIGTVQTSFCHAVFYVPPVRVSEPYKHRSVTQYSTFHPSEYRNCTNIVLSRSILRSTRQSIGTVQTSFCHAVFYVPPVRVSEPYKHRSVTQYSTFHPSEYRNRTNIVLSRSILRSTRQSIGTVQTSFCHAVFYVPPVRVSELYKHRSVTQYSTFHPSEYRNCTNIVLSRSILRSTRQSIGTVQTSFCHAVFYVPPVRVSEPYKHRSVTQYSTFHPSEYRNCTNIVLSRSILRSTRQSIGTVQTSFCHAVFYVPPVRVSEPYKHRSVTQYSTFHPSEYRNRTNIVLSRSILRSTRQSIGTVQTSFCHAVFYVPPVRVSEPYKHRSVTQYSTFHPSEYRNCTNIVLSRSILRSTRQSIGTVQTSFCHAVFYVPPVRVSELYKHRSVTQYSTFHPSEYRNRTNIVLSRSILRSTRQSIGTVQTSFCHAVFYVPPVRVSELYKHRSVTQYSTFHPSEYRNCTNIVLSRSILRSTRQSIGTVQTSFCHAVFYVPPVRVSEPYKHRSVTQYSTFHPSEYRNCTNIVLSRSILRSTRQSIGTVQTSFCHAVFYVPPVRVSELYKHRSVTQYSTFHPSEYRNCTNIVLSRSILRSTRQSIGTVQTSFCHAVFYVPPVRVSELYKHRSVTQYSTFHPSEYRNCTNIVLSRSILRSTRQSIGTVQTSFCHAVFYVPPVRVSELYKHRSVTQYSTFHPSEYRNCTNIVLSRSILRSTRQSIGTVQTSFCHAVFYVPPVRVSEPYKHRSVTQYSTFHPSEYRNCTNIVLSRSILRSTRQSIGTVQTSFCHAVFYVPPVRVSEPYKHRSVTQYSTFHPSEYRNCTNIVLSRSILRSTRQSIGTVQTSFCHAVFYVPPVRVSELYKHRSVTQYSTFHPSEYRNCTNIVLSRSILRSTRQSIGTVQTSFCHAVFYVPPVRVSELYKHRSVTQYSTFHPSEYRNCTNIVLSRSILRSTRQSIGTVQTSFCHAVFYVPPVRVSELYKHRSVTQYSTFHPSEYRNCTNIVLSRSILRSTRQSIGTVQTSFCHAVFYVQPVRVSELYKHRSVTQYSTFHPSEYRNCTNIVLSRSILRSTRQSIGTVQTSFCHAVFYVQPVRVSELYKHRSVTQYSTFHPSEYRNCTNIVLSRSILRSTRQSIGTVQTSFCQQTGCPISFNPWSVCCRFLLLLLFVFCWWCF